MKGSESVQIARLLAIEQVAEILSFSVRTVRRLVVSQGLVAVKFGKSLRFTLADIEAFIQQSRLQSGVTRDGIN
jgi:excisionase family DNA binding protein